MIFCNRLTRSTVCAQIWLLCYNWNTKQLEKGPSGFQYFAIDRIMLGVLIGNNNKKTDFKRPHKSLQNILMYSSWCLSGNWGPFMYYEKYKLGSQRWCLYTKSNHALFQYLHCRFFKFFNANFI